ncbi:MAG: hypothetical protein QXR76_03675 [Candidatus Bathyarchaeia archaeon]
MVCNSCVAKLAYRLMRNHKVDMMHAFELAEKAVLRVENNKRKAEAKLLNDPPDPRDYTQACPDAGLRCSANTDCTE